MHILIAPDKFKGSLTALEVGQAIARGIASVHEDYKTTIIPMADGGEGSLDILESHLTTEVREILVKDPLGRSITSSYLMAGKTAYVEMSRASGLQLLTPLEQNPLYTSTYGTGEMVLDAISHGATHIYVFLGGSATNDMGIGMAEALGYEFLDRDGDRVPAVGLSLAFIVDIKKKLLYNPDDVKFCAVTDVNNPLYGKDGATQRYVQQKGADKYARYILEKGVKKLSRRCKKLMNKDVSKIAGAGAAGGLAGGMIAFLDAEITAGTEFMMNVTGLVDQLSSVDLVITGEGLIDQQTTRGKVAYGVAKAAHAQGIPVLAFCGESKLSAVPNEITQVYDLITLAGSKEKSIAQSAKLLETLSAKVIADYTV